MCTLCVWTRQELSRIIFVSKATASTIPPTQARQRSQNGVSSHNLPLQSPSWSRLWQQPLVRHGKCSPGVSQTPTAPWSLSHSFSSHGYERETSPHLKESLPANQPDRTQTALGTVTSTVYTVWSQKWLIAHTFLRHFILIHINVHECIHLLKWLLFFVFLDSYSTDVSGRNDISLCCVVCLWDNFFCYLQREFTLSFLRPQLALGLYEAQRGSSQLSLCVVRL